MITGNEAGKQLIDAGVLPVNCYQAVITLSVGGLVHIESHSYCSIEQWKEIRKSMEVAQEAGTVTLSNTVFTPDGERI